MLINTNEHGENRRARISFFPGGPACNVSLGHQQNAGGELEKEMLNQQRTRLYRLLWQRDDAHLPARLIVIFFNLRTANQAFYFVYTERRKEYLLVKKQDAVVLHARYTRI